MKKYRNGGPTGKRIPGALYPGDRGYVPPPGDVGYRDWYYPHANDRFYTTDQEYIDLRFQPGPDENPNHPVVKMPPGSPAARSTTQVPVEIVKGLRVQGYEPGQVGHVRYDQERRFENGGLMNTDKLKQMYASGGLLKAILKDPKMRQMASDMLASDGKKYEEGGMMKYRNGGPVGADGKLTPPPGTVENANTDFVRIEEPDLEAAYSSFAYNNQPQYGSDMAAGLAKLSPEQRERFLDRAATFARERFDAERSAAPDEAEFLQGLAPGRYEPGSSYGPGYSESGASGYGPSDHRMTSEQLAAYGGRTQLAPYISERYRTIFGQ